MIIFENNKTFEFEKASRFSELCSMLFQKYCEKSDELYLRSSIAYSWFFWTEGPFISPKCLDNYVSYEDCKMMLRNCFNYIQKTPFPETETLFLMGYILAVHGSLFDFKISDSEILLKKVSLSPKTELSELSYAIRFEKEGFLLDTGAKNRLKNCLFEGRSAINEYFRDLIDELGDRQTSKKASFFDRISKRDEKKVLKPFYKSIGAIFNYFRGKRDCYWDKTENSLSIPFLNHTIFYSLNNAFKICIDGVDINETSLIPAEPKHLIEKIVISDEPLFWKGRKTALIIRDWLE